MNHASLASNSARVSLQELLQDNEFFVELIAELTGVERDSVRGKLAREHETLGTAVAEELKAWQIEPHVWSDRLAEFYEQADGFLYETLVWNRTSMKAEMRRQIVEFLAADSPDPQRFIMFGDGLGFDSLCLAEAGHVVDYFEVSQRCIRFATRLSEPLGQKLSIISAPGQIARESYDVAVCLDVLEHVPNPPEVVALLASFLRPGGRLIVHAPFWYIHPNVATHLKSNVRYSGDMATLYRAHGLRPIAAEWFWNPLVLEKVSSDTTPTSISASTRLRLTVGGWLLSLARAWRLPHVTAVRWLIRQDLRRLRDRVKIH